MARIERPTSSRLDQLRQSVKGYRELEKVAAEFRGRAAMTMPARMAAMRRVETRYDERVLDDLTPALVPMAM